MVHKLRLACTFVKEVFKEFGKDNGSLFAAAISFFSLISLIPLMLLAIGAFGYAVGSEVAFNRVVAFAKDYIPIGVADLEENLRALSDESGSLSGLGFIGLLWTGSQVFVILQQVMNIALGAEKKLGFLEERVRALGVVLAAGALFALSLGITSLLTAIRGFHVELLGISPHDLDPVWDLLAVLLPMFISILAFILIYSFLPTKKIATTGPIIGGITAGLLFEAAKYGFRWYVTNVANFSRIYGSLGGVVILVLWVYYVSMIAVLGAEIASVYARHRESGGR